MPSLNHPLVTSFKNSTRSILTSLSCLSIKKTHAELCGVIYVIYMSSLWRGDHKPKKCFICSFKGDIFTIFLIDCSHDSEFINIYDFPKFFSLHMTS